MGLGHRALGLRRSGLVARPRLRRTLAGRLCPNAVVQDGRRLDELTAGRFALVAASPFPAADQAVVRQRGGVCVTAPAGPVLHDWLRQGRAHAVIVRPDGTVLRAGHDLSELCALVPRLG